MDMTVIHWNIHNKVKIFLSIRFIRSLRTEHLSNWVPVTTKMLNLTHFHVQLLSSSSLEVSGQWLCEEASAVLATGPVVTDWSDTAVYNQTSESLEASPPPSACSPLDQHSLLRSNTPTCLRLDVLLCSDLTAARIAALFHTVKYCPRPFASRFYLGEGYQRNASNESLWMRMLNETKQLWHLFSKYL